MTNQDKSIHASGNRNKTQFFLFHIRFFLQIDSGCISGHGYASFALSPICFLTDKGCTDVRIHLIEDHSVLFPDVGLIVSGPSGSRLPGCCALVRRHPGQNTIVGQTEAEGVVSGDGQPLGCFGKGSTGKVYRISQLQIHV